MRVAVLGCLAIVLCGCAAKPFVISNPSRYAAPDIAISSDFEAGKTYYFAIGTDNKLSFPGVEFDSLMYPLEPEAGVRLVRIYHDRTSSAAVKRDHGQRHAKRS